MGTLIDVVKQFKETVRATYGIGFNSYLKFFYYGFFEVSTFVVIKLDTDCTDRLHDLGNEYEIHIDDLDKLNQIRLNRSMSKEFYCDQSHRGGRFYLVTVNGEPAYIHWVFFKGSDSRFLLMKEQQAEINYVITMPDFRGRNLCSKVASYTVRDLAEQGIENIFVVIHSDNIASLKAFCKIGFVEINRIKRILRMNLRLTV